MVDGIESLFRVDGRRALVTGASSGLGRRFALTLARAGAELDRRRAPRRQTGGPGRRDRDARLHGASP